MTKRWEWPARNLNMYLDELAGLPPRERLAALSALRDVLEATESRIDDLEAEAYDAEAGFGLIPEDPGR